MNQKSIIKYRGDFLDYLEVELGLSNNTQKNYDRFLQKFINWLESSNLIKLTPCQLNSKHIWDYRLYLSRHVANRSKSNLKKSTQNLYLIALRKLLDYFVEKEISSLPPTKVKLAKDKSDKEIKFLNLDQVEKLLLAPNTSTKIGLRDKSLLEILFSTGLRVAELISLNRDQIIIKEPINDIELSILGKGQKIRTVYISKRAANWLKKYIDRRSDLDEALFINYKPGIEKTNLSRRLTKKSVNDVVKKYVKIAGLPVMATPHTLRHSFATDLLTQGVDLRIVQEFLGHRNIATTQIYTHVTNKQLKDIHKKLHGGKKIRE